MKVHQHKNSNFGNAIHHLLNDFFSRGKHIFANGDFQMKVYDKGNVALILKTVNK
jgi:hypothetical protein